MKISKTWKLEKVLPKIQGSRFAIHNAKLEGEYLIATNGRTLVRHTVARTESDIDGLIPADAIKASRKNGETLEVGEFVKVGAMTLTRPVGDFPQWQNVIPDGKSSGLRVCKVALDAKLLHDLADALGASGAGDTRIDLEMLVEETDRVSRPISVTSPKSPGSLGVIMPCSEL
jgi:hypothetical protein